MISLFNSIAHAWWSWMGAMFLQVLLLIIIVSLIDLLIKRWVWPQIRYALWLLILIKLIIPPTWTLSSGVIPNIKPVNQQLRRIETSFIPRYQEINPAGKAVLTRQPERENQKELKTKNSEILNIRQDSSAQQSSLVWQGYAMLAWLLGMLFFIGLLTARILRLRRWHRQQKQKKSIPEWFHDLLIKTAERFKLERLPAIVFSPQAAAPAVYGVFRPVLLLPQDYFRNLSKEEAEHVLLHELAHLKRGDLLTHGISLMLQIVYWFNPFMIWVRKKIKHVREICCDLTVANRLESETPRYRKTLLNTARNLLVESPEVGMGLLGIFEEPFRLISRLKWLDKETWKTRKLMRISAITVTLLMFVFLLPMGGERIDPLLEKNQEVTGKDYQKLPDKAILKDKLNSRNTAENNTPAKNEVISKTLTPVTKKQNTSGDRLGSAADLGRDIYIKSMKRTETLKIGGKAIPPQMELEEIWLARDKFAMITKAVRFVVDFRRRRILVVMHPGRQYVNIPLPENIEQLKKMIPPKIYAIISQIKISNARVRMLKEKKKVANWNCTGRELSMDILIPVLKVKPHFKMISWLTDDVPIDWRDYKMFMDGEFWQYVLQIIQVDQASLKEFAKLEMKRFEVAQEFSIILPDTRIESSKQCLQVEKKTPPEGIYTIPVDYKMIDLIKK